jgi:hypothetical protein
MENQELAVRDSNLFIAPVVNVQGALQRYQDMKDFIGSILKVDTDYGVIPGTSKPTLLKPGAEKLSTFFGLSTQFVIIEKSEDWTGENHGGEPFFNYWYKCTMTRNSKVVAEGEGSCNSFEKKYRYRSANIKCPTCEQETVIKGKEEYGGGWVCWKNKGGCGAKFKSGDKSIEDQPRGQVKNPDIADIVNTLQKMAQKRAYIAAVLLATNASEYFTQDIEDYIDAYFVPVEPEKKQPAKPKQPTPQNEAPQSPEWFDEPEPSLVDVAVELGGQVKASMSLETAEDMRDSKKRRYGDMTNEELSGYSIGIGKLIAKNGLTPEKLDEYHMKQDAIKVILESRNGK